MSEAKFDNGSSGREERPAAEAGVTCTAVHQIAQECAAAICNGWWKVMRQYTNDDGMNLVVVVPKSVVAERIAKTLNAINARKA